jgi:hypothetical protein
LPARLWRTQRSAGTASCTRIDKINPIDLIFTNLLHAKIMYTILEE